MPRCNITYAQALEYVACNDNPAETGLSDIESAVSTDLLAYIYGKSAQTVAREILRMRLDGDPETAGRQVHDEDCLLSDTHECTCAPACHR